MPPFCCEPALVRAAVGVVKGAKARAGRRASILRATSTPPPVLQGPSGRAHSPPGAFDVAAYTAGTLWADPLPCRRPLALEAPWRLSRGASLQAAVLNFLTSREGGPARTPLDVDPEASAASSRFSLTVSLPRISCPHFLADRVRNEQD